jgi:hypothetical protein
MWSTLPKLADKSFIIAYVVPVVVFVLAIALIFAGSAQLASVMSQLNGLQSFVNAAYALAMLWVFAIFLMLVNDILFKVLEGYYWPISKFACLLQSKRDEFTRLAGERDRLREEWRVSGDAFPLASRRQLDKVRREIVTRFPSELDQVLPTRFGNAIRSFEDYSRSVYGADSIPLWIHLCTVVPKEYQTGVEDFRSQVVCFMNLFYLSLVTAIVALCRFAAQDYDDEAIALKLYLLAICFASIVCAYLFYILSIHSIYSWGSIVKAAFDCYLPELAAKLGYELPPEEPRRREFWATVSRRALFNRKFKPTDWLVAPIATERPPTAAEPVAAEPVEPAEPAGPEPIEPAEPAAPDNAREPPPRGESSPTETRAVDTAGNDADEDDSEDEAE